MYAITVSMRQVAYVTYFLTLLAGVCNFNCYNIVFVLKQGHHLLFGHLLLLLDGMVGTELHNCEATANVTV